MSFFPKDEYVPRRGVAMKVLEPNPNLRMGVMRDVIVEAEAQKFAEQEFVLSRAMSNNVEKFSKVRTFKSGDIPWAAGNGNVLAPPKPEPKQYVRTIGQRVPDEMISKFYHGHHRVREREAHQDIMQYSCNFSDNFSPQKPDRNHKILPRSLEEHKFQVKDLEPINGFKGLGSVCRDRPLGKGHVPETTYDPLGMRRWSPRITGLKRLAASNKRSFEEGSLQYDDKIPFESHMKVAYRTPHRHEFPSHQKDDMEGFRGLGVSDLPGPPHGRKHNDLTHYDHHYLNQQQLPPIEQAASPSSQASPSSAHQQPQQFRSASSLGMQDPRRNGGNVSAPPPSTLLYHPVRH